MTTHLSFLFVAVLVLSSSMCGQGQLTTKFYEKTCPKALETIGSVMKLIIKDNPNMGAALLRMHFHDCFVQGCDASILLDDDGAREIESEKDAPPNLSLRGFEVIDDIKRAVDESCGKSVVSCADILTVATRDAVVLLGGPSYEVQLGRRDSKSADFDLANDPQNLPSPAHDLPKLIEAFKKHGLTLNDLVVLSGGHTLGFANCSVFFDKRVEEESMDPQFIGWLKQQCPNGANTARIVPLDETPKQFDNNYFVRLINGDGVLHSDQQLYRGDGGESDQRVKYYKENPEAFKVEFGKAMIKLGSIGVLTGHNGEIRGNCRRVNGNS